MGKFNRYLITAALPYANGPVHIGHLAGCYIPADIYVRYLRAKKADVKFVCGTDEHGVPITIKAMKEGVTPQDVVDKYHKIIGDSFAAMGISFDIFSRTSNQIHHKTSQEFFLKMYNDGLFEEKESEQYFDPEKNVFLADRYIIGTCPKCGNDKAYGDQCERCGTSLSPDELINPHSALSNAVPVKKKTKHWYMPLQNYEPWLKQWVLEEHKDWKNNVYGQCKSWLDSGLQSRAMTRDSNWGIQVPLPDAEGKVLYVWFDAPIGYISATKELTDNWADYWCKEDTKLVHFIGKDNIVFHCIIFPAMLKAHGNFVLPDNVPANEFLNLEGEKISTSRNWAVWVDEFVADFPDQQDVLRYVLCSTAPETKDNDFTWKDFQDRNNNELVAVFGNFVNRALVLMHKLCGGKVPKLHPAHIEEGDREIISEFATTKERIEKSIESYRFREALAEVIDFARKGNIYLQKNEPWKLASAIEKINKGETHEKFTAADLELLQARIDICLHICLQMSANLAIFCNPFLPFTAKKICHLLKVVDRMLEWENAGKTDLLKVGYSLRAPELLFKKIEDDQIKAQLDKLNNSRKKMEEAAKAAELAAQPAAPPKPEIQYEDFAKLDLRVGTIIKAEKVEKADKLLKLLVDIGTEQRTVVSGIAMHFAPEDIIGKQVTLVANLAPRKMRGIESQGMILMAEDKGKLVFVNPNEAVTPGSGVS
ncbi:methionyl-tRNA synthetase [Chitinophaga terrae (ex Kim and Jung 2007)]|uniref:Methionine--tRNA ligase n=1 Tax=Chitinophaga terrae (ex Kim and Jung 2007) TaxID=408074 RepID=A0A1H4DPF5_9BACT|nr:methionine--tRNA ligase [Chitinophaga terrae (ex Kim and Jung 2007)]MDQ0107885.1 methionyl-tRNA synthetase [Chitinophaga terrae (ex Kim and Jung 2007)]GEP91055.1 methionine--tRNA ligase [Chitinophaga terrae (ex Kim and Jung 2007)]SEA74644.1 methionyl-tRNA synthetase [Chitinophaga terrae (ex Kim and Jung 2007)]